MMQEKEQAAFDKWSDENMDYDNGLDAEAAWMECAKQKNAEIARFRDALQKMNKDQKIEDLERRITELEQKLTEALRFLRSQQGISDLWSARYQAMMTRIDWYPSVINKGSK